MGLSAGTAVPERRGSMRMIDIIGYVLYVVFIVFAIYGILVLWKWKKVADKTDSMLDEMHEDD